MTENNNHINPRTGRMFMRLSSVAFVVFGLVALLLPSALARTVEIELSSATALADFRAMYGGMSLGIGLLLIQGLRRPSWYLPSLLLLTVTCGTVATARIYSTLVSGVPSEMILAFAAIELLAFGLGLWSYRRLTRNRAEPVARAVHA
jgi:hypothetical protein